MTRRRSYVKEFDYYGVAAIEAEYNDGFDSWEEISDAFKKYEEINLKRSHNDVRVVGKLKHWDLDKTNKKAYIGINKGDLDDDVEFDKINSVSIEYVTEKDKIIGIDHICIGNNFVQKCPEDVCNIVRQRGDEPDTTTDVVDEPDEIEEPTAPEEVVESDEDEISTKILKEEIELLKKQIEELSKVKDEPETEPAGEEDEEEKQDKKIKLGFQKQLKHELPTEKDDPKSGLLSRKWNFINN